MNPVKPSEIYKKYSDKSGVSEEDVTDINKFYWKHVKNKMTSLVTPSIYLTGLGRFSLKQNKIFPAIEKYRESMKHWREKEIHSPITIGYEQNYKLLSDMGNILKAEWERKKEHREKRKNNE